MGRGDTVRVWLTCIATFLASRAALADGDLHRKTIAAAGRKAWEDAYNSTPQLIYIFFPTRRPRSSSHHQVKFSSKLHYSGVSRRGLFSKAIRLGLYTCILYVCIYIYIYIYTHIEKNIYIYIYIYNPTLSDTL